MSTLVVFAATTDGYLTSAYATHAAARTGPATGVSTTNTAPPSGQQFSSPTFTCWEVFIPWDTSALVDSLVSACDLSLWLSADNSGVDFIQRVRLNPWTVPLTTDQWVPGEDFPGSYTLLAHIDTNGIGATGEYKTFLDDDFAANVNTSGFTTVVLTSDRFEAGTAPTSFEYVQFYSANQAGTTNDPKLTITYSPLPIPPRHVYSEFPKFLLRSA